MYNLSASYALKEKYSNYKGIIQEKKYFHPLRFGATNISFLKDLNEYLYKTQRANIISLNLTIKTQIN